MNVSIRHLLLAGMGVLSGFAAQASEKVSLPLGPEMTRADLYVQPYHGEGEARGTLVLAPGVNGNGQGLIDGPGWKEFAAREHLNLAGLSFASEKNGLTEEQGYYHAATSGSGKDLLDGLKQVLGNKTGPLLLYGFSRGGQFTYSFAHWKPELVLGWCAYTATQWDGLVTENQEGKGIIACGEEDEPNYDAALFQFTKGRSLGRAWTWLSLAHTGHTWSTELDGFVRTYFSSILADSQSKGLWLDVDTKTPVSADELQKQPTLAVWLPDEHVADAWRKLHQP